MACAGGHTSIERVFAGRSRSDRNRGCAGLSNLRIHSCQNDSVHWTAAAGPVLVAMIRRRKTLLGFGLVHKRQQTSRRAKGTC